MQKAVKAFRGAFLLRQGWDKGEYVTHYYQPRNGTVIEVVEVPSDRAMVCGPASADKSAQMPAV